MTILAQSGPDAAASEERVTDVIRSAIVRGDYARISA